MFDRVAVIGAGTMGHGIAQVAAMAGRDVRLVDTDPDVLDEALDRIRANLETGVARGKVEPAVRDEALRRLRSGTDLSGEVREADLVIEAVPEKIELKRKVLGAAEAAAPVAAVLASNTSSLSIEALQEGRARPERVVGLHFFNPVHIMKLVEVVWTEKTDRAVVDAAVEFVRELGKTPVLVKDSPGFASSRLGLALGLEAMRMVEEGVASANDIDTAMTLGYRHPVGPLRLTDLVGLDVRLHIAEYLHETLGSEHFRPPRILREKVERGELGRKTGQGFFSWERASREGEDDT